MKIPNNTQFKDINSAINLPKVSIETLETYLNPVDKRIDDEYKNR